MWIDQARLTVHFDNTLALGGMVLGRSLTYISAYLSNSLSLSYSLLCAKCNITKVIIFPFVWSRGTQSLRSRSVIGLSIIYLHVGQILRIKDYLINIFSL